MVDASAETFFGRLKQKLEKTLVEDNFQLVCHLTLVLLLLYSSGYWYARDPIRVLCIGGLAFPWLLRKPDFWFLVFCIVASVNYFQWHVLDNHKYLMTYWCLVMFVATNIDRWNPGPLLAANGKWLIGLSMGFAVVWKVINPNYWDGSFFEHTLLTDSRFFYFTHFLTGISIEALWQNVDLIKDLKSSFLDGKYLDAVTLNSNSHVVLLAHFMTYWTVFIEGLIALLFLAPGSPLRETLRNWSLIIFAVTTYSVATVTGFAWLLLAMAVAQTSEEQKYFRVLFILVFMLVVIYGMPWGKIIF